MNIGLHDPELTTRVVRTATHLLMRTALRIYNRLEIAGCENLPVHGSFIMVSNHSSHLDAACLMAALPLRRTHSAFPVAAADYFFSTTLRSILSRTLLNAVSLDREHDSMHGLGMCRAVLSKPDAVLIMFPEGTRSCDGSLGRFRSGVVRLVAGTSIPVVPCRLDGAGEAWPKGCAVPRPLKAQLRIGRPRTFENVPSDNRGGLSDASAQLRDDVASLKDC